MLLADDIHDIFALINGKIVSFLVQNMQIISTYLLPHPPPSHPNYPAKQPSLPSSEKGNHCFFFLSDICLSVLLSVHLNLCSIRNSSTAESTLRIWNRRMKVYGSLRN